MESSWLYRKRQWDTATCYSRDGNIAYCNNIHQLVEELQPAHTPLDNEGFFTDSSRVSLKAVSLHNGNKFHSIPVARAVHVKETYENLQVLLRKIHMNTGGIYVNLKVTAMQSCKVDTLISAVFNVTGTVERRTSTTEYKKRHSVQKQHQVRRTEHILPQGINKKSICLHYISSSVW